MIIIKNKTQIDGIRKSSQLAAKTLDFLSKHLTPGVSTQDLNRLGHQFIVDNGAIPAPLGYGGYPKSICTSINDVVCHGIPSPTETLKEGDIINLDITTILNNFFGDTSASFPVGTIDPKAKLLLERTKQALQLSIASLKPGRYLNDCVGGIIEPYVTRFGYSVVRELGGHGVGLSFHEDPFVFHYDTRRRDYLLKAGMIFTIEPMINASSHWQVALDRKDGWTVRTKDGSLSAQFEHTVLITPTGSEVLTQL